MDNASDLRLFLQQHRDECFKHIGKVMYESCPELGGMCTHEDFIRFCSVMRRQSPGTRLNVGYELRVSWSLEELSRDSPEGIQRACECSYLLRKEVAPNAPCWVTVHTDGEGGCVHVHAIIVNHDLVSGAAIAHGTDHATVKRESWTVNCELRIMNCKR